ncbi:MAG TPA: SRPBCC family protein [Acidobacteriaceae bacterium]|nr:SRPBCC family protein [Acidobacteriaceae bacterium]
MPQLVDQTQLPTFPAGQGKGAHFRPLPQDVEDGKVRAHTLQTINADRQTLYGLWRNVSNAPKFQEYVVSVTPVSETRSTWTFGDPEEADGKRLTYDTEIFEDIPGEKIAWRSVDTDFEEQGEVHFTDHPAGRGTIVTLIENMEAIGGRLGIAAAALTKRTPRQIVIEDLRHFKELAESGEIPTVVGNSHGPRGFTGSIKLRLYGENNPTPPGTSFVGHAEAATSTPS